MADSQHTKRSAVVTPAKRDSYFRHVQIHMELLYSSLTGQTFGCGVGDGDREEIDRHLFEIWKIARAAKLVVVDPRPAPGAAPSTQGGNVIPFRPRLAG